MLRKVSRVRSDKLGKMPLDWRKEDVNKNGKTKNEHSKDYKLRSFQQHSGGEIRVSAA